MWHRLIRALGLGLALATLGLTQPSQAATSDPTGFVQDLGDQSIKILKGSTDLGTRKAAFSKIFTQDFDVPKIGRFVLGRYWQQATPEQQKDYIAVFGEYVVNLYSGQFSSYSGEQFKVQGSRPGEQGRTTVNSQIVRPNGGPPIQIDWTLQQEDGGYKIIDVSAEDISLTLTKRQEFASVIEKGGGVQALIDLLKQKIAQ
ncbi:MAG TPA: ABC transporter substrate-binding protein [Aliidongia sp.]|nr:ABC transporter substrate-binding protein [Aliidongia sp.]